MIPQELRQKVVSDSKLWQAMGIIKYANCKLWKTTKETSRKDIEELYKTIETTEKDLYGEYSIEEVKDAERVKESQCQRAKRLRQRIKNKILPNQKMGYASCFITLTFSDKFFNSTNEETRRKYVEEFLSNNSNEYVANIDYGKENEREHYHGIANININELIPYSQIYEYRTINAKRKAKNKFETDNWKYGNACIEIIRTQNLTSLSNYVLKFVNHALKTTTKSQSLIYSRQKRKSC